MVNAYDVDPSELIEKVAVELKKDNNIKAPEWAVFVKTGVSRERPPARQDWWYLRAASMLRKLYVFSPIGVNTLRRVYGGRKNRGVKPDRVKMASGNIIRKILQQLEKAGLAAKTQKGVHKGRTVSPKGKSLLDKIATQIYKEVQKNKQKEEEIAKMEAPKHVEHAALVQQKPAVQEQQKVQSPQQKPQPQKPAALAQPHQKPVASAQPQHQKPHIPQQQKPVQQQEQQKTTEPQQQKPVQQQTQDNPTQQPTQ